MDARRFRRQCSVAWPDFTNAFGSVFHETIVTFLQLAGLNEDSISVICCLNVIKTTTTEGNKD
jgi:hypothetical protein